MSSKPCINSESKIRSSRFSYSCLCNMNMNLLAVVTPPSAIYRGFSNRKTFWEEKFAPANMQSYGRRNVRKHREINNGDKCIILDILYTLDCMYKREVTSSESRDYMVIPGKGVNTSLYIRTKGKNKKENSGFVVTDVTNHNFRKSLKNFMNSPHLGFKSKQFHNEPTEAYFFPIK